MSVGVISDTHGLLRPEAVAALRDSELILHAGDVGDPEILKRLRNIAPTVAVRGNVDTGAWASALPLTEVVEVDTLHLYMLHDLAALDLDPKAAGLAAVISGHTHRPLARACRRTKHRRAHPASGRSSKRGTAEKGLFRR